MILIVTSLPTSRDNKKTQQSKQKLFNFDLWLAIMTELANQMFNRAPSTLHTHNSRNKSYCLKNLLSIVMELSIHQRDYLYLRAKKFSNHTKTQLTPLTKNWTSARSKLSKDELHTVANSTQLKKYSKNTFKHKNS